MAGALSALPAQRCLAARERRVEEILEAAREVFCRKGYEGAAMAEIAARLGVVEGTLYKYFDSKRSLLLKVLEHWYEQMFGDYSQQLAGVRGARQRLRLLVWHHLRTIAQEPSLCRLMFREVRSGQDYEGSELHAMNRRYTELLVEVLREGVAAGEFRGGMPLPLLRDMVYGGIEHHAWNFIRGRGALDVDAVADQITAIVCDGIAVRQAPADLERQTRRLAAIADRMERKLPPARRRTV
jgi:AcrR family transcriptional regulator